MTQTIIGPDDPALNVLAEAITDHPELSLELRTIPWAQYRDTLMETLTAGTAAAQAVFVPGHIWLPELVEAGYLAPLEPLFDSVEDTVLSAYDAGDIVPQIAAECRYGERQYQLPFFSDGHILFYRSDLITLEAEEGGVPVVSTRMLQALAAEHHNPPEHYGLALKADVSEIFTDFLPYLWEVGGALFDAEGNPDFASAANIEALERYCALRPLCPPKTDHYGNAEIAESLRVGEAALVANWGGQTAPIVLDPDNPWRDIYRPAVFTTPWNATWGIAIPANQPSDIQQQTLSALMQTLNPEQDREITRQAGSPVRESSYAADQLTRYPWLAAQREMLRRARPLPTVPTLGRYLGALYEAVHKAFTGELSAAEALRGVEEASK
jgi:multiple sugar transport system substrate-binding protein